MKNCFLKVVDGARSTNRDKVSNICLKLLSVVLSCILIVSMFSTQALASNKKSSSGQNTEINQPKDNGANLNRPKSYVPKIDEMFVDGLLADFGLWNGCPGSVKWWTRNFLANILVDVFYPEELAKKSPELEILEELNAKQGEILKELENFSDQLKTQDYVDILNHFNFVDGFGYIEKGVSVLHKTYAKYKKYYDNPETMDETIKAAIEKERKDNLTQDLGISDCELTYTNLEEATDEMAKLIYHDYDLGNGQHGPLFYIKQLDMRQQTAWEHQAWEQLENYNSCTLVSFLTLALLDTASINARLEMIEDLEDNEVKNASRAAFYARLNIIKQEVNLVKDAYYKYRIHKNVNYRHFWHRGQDLYFRPTIEKYSIPQENYLEGQSERQFSGYTFDQSNLFHGDWGGSNTGIRDGQWNSIQPGKNGEHAITTDNLNVLLKDRDDESLSNILAAGDFEGLDGDYSLDTKNKKQPILVFNYNDNVNKFYTYHHEDACSGDTVYEWKPRAKGVGLKQKEAVTAASDIETYRYYSHSISLPIGGKTELFVKDLRNKDQVYYSLIEIPKSELAFITTETENGSADGYIFQNSEIKVPTGTKVRSINNKLVFTDQAGNVLATQIAMAASNKCFAGWQSSCSGIQKGTEIEGTIDQDTTLKAVYKDGLQASISINDDTFIENDENFATSATGLPMAGATDIQYKIDGQVFSLRFKAPDSSDYKTHVFTPQSSDTTTEWMISGVKNIIKDSNWHNFDNEKDLKTINVDGSSKKIGTRLNMHFGTSDLKLGGFYVGPRDPAEAVDVSVFAKDGIVDLELYKQEKDDNQVIKIKWTDAKTGEQKNTLVVSQKFIDNAYIDFWADANDQIMLSLKTAQHYTYHCDNVAEESIEFTAFWRL